MTVGVLFAIVTAGFGLCLVVPAFVVGAGLSIGAVFCRTYVNICAGCKGKF
jgi:hypothetical protein